MHIKPQVQCLNLWYNLGVLLDVPVQKLEDIRLSEQDDLDLCCVKMFTEWLENGTDTTWSTLLRAVVSLYNKQIDPNTKLIGMHLVFACNIHYLFGALLQVQCVDIN